MLVPDHPLVTGAAGCTERRRAAAPHVQRAQLRYPLFNPPTGVCVAGGRRAGEAPLLRLPPDAIALLLPLHPCPSSPCCCVLHQPSAFSHGRTRPKDSSAPAQSVCACPSPSHGAQLASPAHHAGGRVAGQPRPPTHHKPQPTQRADLDGLTVRAPAAVVLEHRTVRCPCTARPCPAQTLSVPHPDCFRTPVVPCPYRRCGSTWTPRSSRCCGTPCASSMSRGPPTRWHSW
jgi:hypothetical protein